MRISDWSSDVCSSDLNLDIEQARINERISDVDYRQSKYDLLPDLNGSASHSISFGRSVNPITDVIDDQRISAGGFNLNANLLLFSGFQRLNSIAQARYAMMSNQTAAERIKQQVMVNVAATERNRGVEGKRESGRVVSGGRGNRKKK